MVAEYTDWFESGFISHPVMWTTGYEPENSVVSAAQLKAWQAGLQKAATGLKAMSTSMKDVTFEVNLSDGWSKLLGTCQWPHAAVGGNVIDPHTGEAAHLSCLHGYGHADSVKHRAVLSGGEVVEW